VEYVSSLATADKNGRIQNPAGLLIYYLRDDTCQSPADFVTSKKAAHRRGSTTSRTLNNASNL